MSIHPSAQQSFSKNAELYQKARPSYPSEITSWLSHTLNLNHTSEVIDLGAGTGKFIPFLQNITSKIQAIEPIPEMLEQLRQQYPTVHCIQTDSKHLKIADQSIDAILCAQSFHWFADSNSLHEIHRVLKPQSSLGLIWNQRDTSFAWVNEIAQFLLPFEGNTPRYHRGTWRNVFQNTHLFDLQSEQTFQFFHTGTVEQVVIQRLLSSSFVAIASKAQKEHIYQHVLHIVKKHLNKDLNDHIEFPYLTHAYHYLKI